MKEKTRTKINIYLNLCLFVMIVGGTVAWMLTAPSSGENLQYARELIIASTTVTVDVYEYRNGSYVLLEDSPFLVNNLAPGVTKLYRFDITNEQDVMSSSNIIFTNITGDITELSSSLSFGATSPMDTELKLGTNIVYNESEDNYYMKFLNNVRVEPGETLSVYWYVTMDYRATNEVANKTLSIETITFIKA